MFFRNNNYWRTKAQFWCSESVTIYNLRFNDWLVGWLVILVQRLKEMTTLKLYQIFAALKHFYKFKIWLTCVLIFANNVRILSRDFAYMRKHIPYFFSKAPQRLQFSSQLLRFLYYFFSKRNLFYM